METRTNEDTKSDSSLSSASSSESSSVEYRPAGVSRRGLTSENGNTNPSDNTAEGYLYETIGTGPERSTRSHPQPLQSLYVADTSGIPRDSVKEIQSQKAQEARQAGITEEGKENDLEADLLSRIIEGIKEAKKHHDEATRLSGVIMELEEKIKAVGYPTVEQHKELDGLYRDMLRHSQAEADAHHKEDIVNNIAVLSAMKSSDEPAPRNGTGKSRKNQKQILESDIIAESPSTPVESRGDILKRVKGATQRSSSTASQSRAAIVKEEVPEIKIDKSPLTVGTEVFYKLQSSDNDEGVGQHQIIKKIYQEKKGYSYDLRDPDKDQATRNRISGRHLAVIPTAAQVTPIIFANGQKIYARYPDTDTFYEAEVRNYSKAGYALLFEGEEDAQNEHLVERRYVFDPSRWK